MIHVCTSAALNYLPKARVLGRSVKRYHPEVTMHLILADRHPDWLDTDAEPFDDIISMETLHLPNLESWLFRYSIVGVCTAVKPFALKSLLNTPGCQAVLYLDPDMVVFSRLDDLIDSFAQSSVLLTPHQTEPEQTLQRIIDNEMGSLKWGVFNLGFIGVRNDANARSFLDWWSERVDKFCYKSLEDGLWVDQKWVNLAPVFFEGVQILKSARFNVASWNLTTRMLEGSFESGFTVNGEPLGFYHFTGFDRGAHDIMAAKNSDDNQAVRRLISWYRKATKSDDRVRKERGVYSDRSTFSNGAPITEAHRIIYRTRTDLQKVHPNPFEVTEQGMCYLKWFQARAAIDHPDIYYTQASGRFKRLRSIRGNSLRICLRVFSYLKWSIIDRKYRSYLLRTGWLLIRKEGLRGLMRYLSR